MLLRKEPRQRFDVTNPEHRKIAVHAIKTLSWGKAPYKFELEPEYSDVMTMVKTKIFDYYVAQDEAVVKA